MTDGNTFLKSETKKPKILKNSQSPKNRQQIAKEGTDPRGSKNIFLD